MFGTPKTMHYLFASPFIILFSNSSNIFSLVSNKPQARAHIEVESNSEGCSSTNQILNLLFRNRQFESHKPQDH
jgi:hypothetical protein